MGPPNAASAAALQGLLDGQYNQQAAFIQQQGMLRDSGLQGLLNSASAPSAPNPVLLLLDQSGVIAQGTPTRSAETSGSVAEGDGGPVAKPCAQPTAQPSPPSD